MYDNKGNSFMDATASSAHHYFHTRPWSFIPKEINLRITEQWLVLFPPQKRRQTPSKTVVQESRRRITKTKRKTVEKNSEKRRLRKVSISEKHLKKELKSFHRKALKDSLETLESNEFFSSLVVLSLSCCWIKLAHIFSSTLFFYQSEQIPGTKDAVFKRIEYAFKIEVYF